MGVCRWLWRRSTGPEGTLLQRPANRRRVPLDLYDCRCPARIPAGARVDRVTVEEDCPTCPHKAPRGTSHNLPAESPGRNSKEGVLTSTGRTLGANLPPVPIPSAPTPASVLRNRSGKPRLSFDNLAARNRCADNKARGLPCGQRPSSLGAFATAAPAEGRGVGSTPMRAIHWAYGVTTVPSRRATYLPRTLVSLRKAGFDRPRLFVDGAGPGTEDSYRREFGLEVSVRTATWDAPTLATGQRFGIGAWGNWVMGAWELLIREPACHYYAMFQDDLILCRNVRTYLERLPLPGTEHDPQQRPKGYYNLFTFQINEPVVAGRGVGWHESAEIKGNAYFGRQQQGGRGALALVFPRDTLLALLGSAHLGRKTTGIPPGNLQQVDGGIVEALNQAGYREYVHNPTLVAHTGEVSSLGKRGYPQPETWKGEEFDALSLTGVGSPING